jgi:hypothetical protein
MVLSINDAIAVGVALGNEPENSNVVDPLYSSIGEHEAQMIRGELGVVNGFRVYQQRQVLATALALAASSGMPAFAQHMPGGFRDQRKSKPALTQDDYDRLQAAQARRERRNQKRLKSSHD